MYKIAEMFYSLQGEGHWSGTPMVFVRMSQCPVGGPEGICKSFEGREFVCDTGRSYTSAKTEFHPYSEVNATVTTEDIGKFCQEHNATNLCLTGGEPLIYDLKPLWDCHPCRIHIETSGTIYTYIPPHIWVTVSPKHGCKKGMIDRADEVKLLVDRYTPDTIVNQFFGCRELFLQPIEDDHWIENRDRAVELCLKHGCRLSLQTHKLLGLR